MFSRGIGKREKEEAYVEEALRQASSEFNLTPLANQDSSPSQPE